MSSLSSVVVAVGGFAVLCRRGRRFCRPFLSLVVAVVRGRRGCVCVCAFVSLVVCAFLVSLVPSASLVPPSPSVPT